MVPELIDTLADQLIRFSNDSQLVKWIHVLNDTAEVLDCLLVWILCHFFKNESRRDADFGPNQG